MKLLFLVFSVFIFFSCSSIKWKKKEITKESQNIKSTTIKKIPVIKSDNWANDYYQRTYFIVDRPKVLESYKELVKVCKSQDFEFISDYQRTSIYPIKFKKEQITIVSENGFSKKVFITKGACRELSLYKAPKKGTNAQFRKGIKSMQLVYVYNKGTYLKKLEFKTQYLDVQFLVE